MNLPQDPSALFKGRHFDCDIIVLCVRWYVTYKAELSRPRGDDGGATSRVAHTTILRWVQRYMPDFLEALAALCSVGGLLLRVDET